MIPFPPKAEVKHTSAFLCITMPWLGNPTGMAWLIALFLFLFSLLLLGMPIPVSVRARLGKKGGAVRLTAYAFGLIPIRLRFRVHLLSHPYFTLHWRGRVVHLLQRKRRAEPFPDKTACTLFSRITVGIEGDPALAAVLLGLASVALSCVTVRLSRRGSVKPVLCPTHSVLRITLCGTYLLYPHRHLLYACRRRIKAWKSGHNSRIPKEKRKLYEPC